MLSTAVTAVQLSQPNSVNLANQVKSSSLLMQYDIENISKITVKYVTTLTTIGADF